MDRAHLAYLLGLATANLLQDGWTVTRDGLSPESGAALLERAGQRIVVTVAEQ